jgi:flagellar biogenesis protein FliO
VTRRSVSLALAAAAALLVVSASMPAGSAHAQETQKREAAHAIPYKQESSFADQLIALGIALATVAVAGAIGIGGYRYLTGARAESPSRRLKVLETLRLSPRTVLFLVEFDRRTLLIGQQGDRLTLLLGPPETGSPEALEPTGQKHASTT